MAQYDGSIRLNTKIETEKAKKEISNFEKYIEKSAEEISKLQSRMKEIEAGKAPTEQYKKWENQLLEAYNTIEKLEEQQKHLSGGLGELSLGQLEEDLSSSKAEFNNIQRELEKFDSVFSQIESRRSELGRDAPIELFQGLDQEYDTALEAYEKLQDRQGEILNQTKKINEAMEFPQEIEKAKLSAGQLEEKLRGLEQSGKAFTFGENADEYASAAARVEELTQGIAEKQSQIAGIQSDLADNEERLAAMKDKSSISNHHIVDVLEHQKQLTKEIADMEKAGIGYGYKEYDSAQQSLAKLNQEIREYAADTEKAKASYKKFSLSLKKMSSSALATAKNIGKKLVSALKKAGAAMLGLNKHTKQAAYGFRGMLKNMLLYGAVSKIINAVTNGAKEGLDNLVQYSDRVNGSMSMLMSSMTQLKNSFATAFAPILNVVAPILSKFINMLSEAATTVGMFFAALTGQKTFEKAVAVQQDYRESLNGSAKAAKKAKKETDSYLSGLDEVRKFETKKNEEEEDELLPEDMFTTVPIDSAVSDFADRVKEVLAGIFDVFKQAWDNKGAAVIASAKAALNSLKDAAKAVGATFYEVFTNGTGLAWVESCLELLRSMLDVVVAIGKAFTEAWTSGAGFDLVTAIFVTLTDINNLLVAIGDTIAEVFRNGTGTEWFTSVFELLTSILGVIDTIAVKFTEAWNSGAGLENITALFTALTNVNNLLISIADSFSRAFSSELGTMVLTNILGIVTGIYDIIGNLALSIMEAWNTAGVGDGIWTAILTIINNVAAFIHNIVDTTAEWAANLDFYPLLESIKNLLESVAPVVQTIGDWLSKIYTKIVLPIAKFLIEVALPGIINAMSGLFDFLNKHEWIIELVGDALIGAFAATKIVPLITKIVGAVRTIIGVLSGSGGLMGVISTIVSALGGPLTIAITAAIAILVLLISNWDKVKETMQRFSDWMKGVFSHDWSREFGVLGDVFNGFLKNLENMWNSVKQIFGGIIDFVAGVFTGDWERAWNGVKSVFEGIWNLFASIVKSPVNAIISVLNALIRGVATMVNNIAQMLNSLKIDIPDWVPKIGGGTLGFNIPTWTPGQIPYLATGAVIPPNREFMAVLGDQKHGTNIEAPLSTIEEAMTNVLRKNQPRQGDVNYKFIGQINRRVLFEEIIEEARLRQTATGRNPFEMA